MNMNDLIQKLATRGIEATAEQIEQALGDVSYLTDADLDTVAEMLSQPDPMPAKSSRRGGKIAKSASRSQITKVDPASLPTAAQIATMDSSELSAQIASLNAVDHASRDVAMLETLAALYARQHELTQLALAAGQALSQGNQAMQAAYQQLNGAVIGAMQGFSQIDDVAGQLAGEGANSLAASFRHSTNLAERFKSATGFDSTFTPDEAQSAA